MFSQQINLKKIVAWIALALLLACFIAAWHRLSLSVELTDEACYQAFSYTYIMGNKPYADVWDPHQNANLLTAPLLGIYHKIAGSYDGSVLFMRRSFLVFKLIILAAIFLVLKKKMSWPSALFCVMPMIYVIPHSVSNFSYNTINLYMILLGSFLIFAASQELGSQFMLFTAGICHAIAAFVYPTFILFCILNILLVFIVLKSNRRIGLKGLTYYCVGGFATALILAITVFIWSGIDQTITGLYGMLSSSYFKIGANIDNVILLYINQVRDLLINKYGLVVLLLSALTELISHYIIKKRPQSVVLIPIWLAINIMVIICITFSVDRYFINYLCLYLFIITCIFLFLIKNRKQRQSVLVCLVIPSLLSLLIRIMTNANVYILMQLYSLVPVFISAPYCIWVLIKENTKLNKDHIEDLDWTFGVFSIALSIGLVLGFFTYVYRDQPVNKLTQRVETGQFKGLYTTTDRKEGIERLQREITAHTNKKSTVMVANQFPAAYVMSNMKPSTPHVWEPMFINYGFRSADYVIDYQRKTGNIADTVLIILSEYSVYDLNDPKIEFNQVLENNYTMVFSSPDATYPLYVFNRNLN